MTFLSAQSWAKFSVLGLEFVKTGRLEPAALALVQFATHEVWFEKQQEYFDFSVLIQ